MMPITLLTLLITAIVIFTLLGIYQFIALAVERFSAVNAATLLDESAKPSIYRTLNTYIQRTKLGQYITRELERAGSQRTPLDVVLAVSALTIAFTAAIWIILAPSLAILGVLGAVIAARLFIQRQQKRRIDKIIAQMPETARVLANASQAGYSLPTAIEFAASEIAEPSRSEMQKIADRLKFGVSLEEALEEFQEKIGSREAGLLISTLIVSSRSGGSLVSALHDISLSLEQRKEIRRQMKTILSESKATANFLIFIGIGALAMLNLLNPGTVQKMTTSFLGIIALGISAALFIGGWLLIQRMGKIDNE